MALLGGLVGKILGLVLLIVVLLLATGIFLYASDYAVEATVIGKNCRGATDEGPTVTVETKIGGLTEEVKVTSMECAVIETGNYVKYHLRTQRTIIYEKDPSTGGRCVYDTQNLVC